MTAAWIVVVAVGLSTFALKAAGPVLLGGRPLPSRLSSVVSLLAPAVLAALVVTQAISDGREIVIDERLLGVAAAGIAVWLRAPLLLVLVIAAGTTALVRAIA
jgi:uncharacterized membrane protein